MSLFRRFAEAVEHEYDRRVRAASLVKVYDPTGASHHGHVEVQNEQVVHAGHGDAAHGDGATTEAERSAPREVTHH
jgi:hypothetical protein